jgi:hypothetical protein
MARTVNVFLKAWRHLRPDSYVRMQMARTERKLHNLHAKRRMGLPTAAQRDSVMQLESDREEFYEWQLEIDDKALFERAEKIGVYPDEITFPQTKDIRNMGRYVRTEMQSNDDRNLRYPNWHRYGQWGPGYTSRVALGRDERG